MILTSLSVPRRQRHCGYQGGGAEHEGVHLQCAHARKAVLHHRDNQEQEPEQLCVSGRENRCVTICKSIRKLYKYCVEFTV